MTAKLRYFALALALIICMGIGSTAPNAENAASRAFDVVRIAFDRIAADYVDPIDDWKVVQGGIAGMLDLAGPQLRGERRVVAVPNRDAMVRVLASVFDRVRAEIRDDRRVAAAAIEGMLRSLDPYSSFADQKQLASATGPTIGGVGLNVTKDGGNVKVVSPIEGGPGEQAGIAAGDIIEKIDGVSVANLPLEQTVARLRGPVGSSVTMELQRTGRRQPIHVTMTRAVVRANTVTSRAESDVGYIRITSFNDQTSARLRSVIEKLQAQIPDDNLKGFVIDLRDNGGGLLTQAVSIASTFLADGEIGTTRGRNNVELERFVAQASDATSDATRGKPIAVLVNGMTGAGAEIVAGALQYHQRAIVVGTRSAGAGTIQTVIPLGGDHGALHLTTSRFYLPADRKLDGNGVVPDLIVEQPTPAPADASADMQLQNALSVLRQPRRP